MAKSRRKMRAAKKTAQRTNWVKKALDLEKRVESLQEELADRNTFAELDRFELDKLRKESRILKTRVADSKIEKARLSRSNATLVEELSRKKFRLSDSQSVRTDQRGLPHDVPVTISTKIDLMRREKRNREDSKTFLERVNLLLELSAFLTPVGIAIGTANWFKMITFLIAFRAIRWIFRLLCSSRLAATVFSLSIVLIAVATFWLAEVAMAR